MRYNTATMQGWVRFAIRHARYTCTFLSLIILTGCAVTLPRAWRESLYGPEATPTPQLKTVPTAAPTEPVYTPTPPPTPTRLPTLTPLPTRTATVTVTPTATPAVAGLTLQQGATWYIGGRFVPYEGTEDTYISAWNRTANYADAPVISIRQGDIMAGLVYFHLGDLPANTPIYHADMSFYVGGRSNDTPMKIMMHAVLKPWLLKEATWLQAKQGLLWQNPGAGGESDRVAPPVGEVMADERGIWLTFDVTNLVKQWIANPQANQGVILTGEAVNAVQYDLISADSRDLHHRPRLMLTFPTGAIALGPANVPTPTPTSTPTVDSFRPEAVNLLRLLPQGSTVLARATGDIDNDGLLEISAAYRAPGERGLHMALFHYYGPTGGPGDYRLIWNSEELSGTTPLGIDLMHLTGQAEPEILVGVTNPAGAGRMLYVFTSRPVGYRLATPVGGYFDGKAFGEAGFELADVNGDGQVEILARHDHQVDIYAWDGANFALVQK